MNAGNYSTTIDGLTSINLGSYYSRSAVTHDLCWFTAL